jgi:hypothetical protein
VAYSSGFRGSIWGYNELEVMIHGDPSVIRSCGSLERAYSLRIGGVDDSTNGTGYVKTAIYSW